MSKKAQASAEYVILIAMFLVVLSVAIILFFNIYGQLKAQTNYELSKNFLFEVSENVKQVYHQGEGARKILFFNIPDFAINFSSSKIENNTILIRTNDFGDIYQKLDFDIEGYFLKNQSSGYFLIENNGSVVKIQPAIKVYVSKAGIYLNSTFSEQIIEIKNYGHVNLDLNQSFFVSGCTSCNYNDSGISVLSPYSNRIGKISVGGLSSGIYVGYLKIETKNNLNYANYSFLLPITIEIP